jgi:hypothetical protein
MTFQDGLVTSSLESNVHQENPIMANRTQSMLTDSVRYGWLHGGTLIPIGGCEVCLGLRAHRRHSCIASLAIFPPNLQHWFWGAVKQTDRNWVQALVLGRC